MNPLHAQCSSCEATLNQVEIPNRKRQHVIERHYPNTHHEEIDPERRPLFFENAISQQSLFTSTTTHSIFQLESSLTDKEASVKLTR